MAQSFRRFHQPTERLLGYAICAKTLGHEVPDRDRTGGRVRHTGVRGPKDKRRSYEGIVKRGPMLESGPVDIVLYLAIARTPFNGDARPLLEDLANFERFLQARRGAILCASRRSCRSPDRLSCDVEGDVLVLVLLFWLLRPCPKRPVRVTLLNVVFGSVSLGCPVVRGTG